VSDRGIVSLEKKNCYRGGAFEKRGRKRARVNEREKKRDNGSA